MPIVETSVPLIEAATATDPEIAAQWPKGPDPRYTVQYAAAEALVGKPDARPGLFVERAADLLFGLLSPQLYQIFVRDRSWSTDAWEEWARTALASQLSAPTQGSDQLVPAQFLIKHTAYEARKRRRCERRTSVRGVRVSGGRRGPQREPSPDTRRR